MAAVNALQLHDLTVPRAFFFLAGPGDATWGPPPLTSAGPRSPGKLSM